MKKFILALAFFIGMIGSAWGHTETVSIQKNTKVSKVMIQNDYSTQNVIVYNNISVEHSMFNIEFINNLSLDTLNKVEVFNLNGEDIKLKNLNGYFYLEEPSGIYFIKINKNSQIQLISIFYTRVILCP